jgi:hypothetical protein
MKVVMQTGISGGRGDGTDWPPVGGILEVGDEEGRALVSAGHAIPYVDPDAGVEKRDTPKRASKAK